MYVCVSTQGHAVYPATISPMSQEERKQLSGRGEGEERAEALTSWTKVRLVVVLPVTIPGGVHSRNVLITSVV